MVVPLVLGVVASLSHAKGKAPLASKFSVIHYEPVSKTLILGNQPPAELYEYKYRVQLRSAANVSARVTGTMSSKRDQISVANGVADFGVVGARETRFSQSDVVVIADERFDRRLDPDELGDGAADKRYNKKFDRVFKWVLVAEAGPSQPIISSFQPQGSINSARPTLSAQYRDGVGGAGIDTAKVALRVDGVDVTAQASVTATGITYQPAAALNEGVHNAVLSVPDTAGNAAQAEWSFRVDTVLPVIGNLQPQGSQSTASPVIGAQYGDGMGGSGINVAKVTLHVDGVDVTAQAAVTAAGIAYQPATALSGGVHNVVLTVADMSGNLASASWAFTISSSGEPVDLPVTLSGTDGSRYIVGFRGDLLEDSGFGDSWEAFYDAFWLSVYYGENRRQDFEVDRAMLTNGGRELVLGPVAMADLQVTRRIYVPVAGGYARQLEQLKNPGAAAITVEVTVSGYLGQEWDGKPLFVSPEQSGGRYAVYMDDPDEPRWPMVAQVFASSGAPLAGDYYFSADRNEFEYYWNVTVPPGGTVTLMHFTALRASNDESGARAQAEALATMTQPGMFEGMSAADRATIKNFAVSP